MSLKVLILLQLYRNFFAILLQLYCNYYNFIAIIAILCNYYNFIAIIAIICNFIAIFTILLQLLQLYCNFYYFIAIFTILLQFLKFYCNFIGTEATEQNTLSSATTKSEMDQQAILMINNVIIKIESADVGHLPLLRLESSISLNIQDFYSKR